MCPEYNPDHETPLHAQSQLQPQCQRPPRPRIVRTKTGCLTCRLRRKRCDEQKPVCRGCKRNELICSWPQQELPAGSSQRKVKRKSIPPGAERSLSLSGTSPEEQLSSSLSDQDAQIQLEDETSAEHEPFEALFLRSLNNLRVDNMKAKALESPASRILFDHYLHRTTGVMSIYQGESNPFIARLLPIAIGNDLILQSVLAVSGIHYAADNSISVSNAAWMHYGDTLYA
jgi:hypothetical protein